LFIFNNFTSAVTLSPRLMATEASNNQPYTSLLSSADAATPIWVIPVAKGGDRIKEEPAK
jgi:hypothetical protein